MAEQLFKLSTISFVVAGVCFAIAVFLWFFLKIPSVIGDLSGRTARKSIAKTREANEKAGTKKHKENKENLTRKKKLDTTFWKLNKTKDEDRPETGLLNENKESYINEQKTDLLEKGTETLDFEQTGLLEDDMFTAPLTSKNTQVAKRMGGKSLTIIEEIIFIHTNETIS